MEGTFDNVLVFVTKEQQSADSDAGAVQIVPNVDQIMLGVFNF